MPRFCWHTYTTSTLLVSCTSKYSARAAYLCTACPIKPPEPTNIHSFRAWLMNAGRGVAAPWLAWPRSPWALPCWCCQTSTSVATQLRCLQRLLMRRLAAAAGRRITGTGVADSDTCVRCNTHVSVPVPLSLSRAVSALEIDIDACPAIAVRAFWRVDPVAMHVHRHWWVEPKRACTPCCACQLCRGMRLPLGVPHTKCTQGGVPSMKHTGGAGRAG